MYDELRKQLNADMNHAESQLVAAQNRIQQIFGGMQLLNHIEKLEKEKQEKNKVVPAEVEVA